MGRFFALIFASLFMPVGSQYAVYAGQNPLGFPIATGTYGGTTISFPMTGLTVETPAGDTAPAVQTPDFAAFIVVKT